MRGPCRRIALFGAALLLGCKAETLGVDVPRGGPDEISVEDLQRDVWSLTRNPGEGDSLLSGSHTSTHSRTVQTRLQQMHTLPAFDDSYALEQAGGGEWICGLKDGRSGKGVVVVAPSVGTRASTGAAPLASLISLAKAFDSPRPPHHSLVLCAAPSEDLETWWSRPALPASETLALFVLGPLDGEQLREETLPAGPEGVTITRLHTGRRAIHGTSEDTLDRIDYRAIRARLGEVHARVVGVEE
ncbi:MAG: hypothetical protein QGG40_07940 [Myxococcota bacterium]|jgi:hypothetical protein|nr:hypothetical protein [Myxococcota bacterium]